MATIMPAATTTKAMGLAMAPLLEQQQQVQAAALEKEAQ